ncbi:hypothetical protein [Sphingobium sp.]|uniref:hypothetical protein n=1 Tax=Sphingobium sp. TaxID=1912891 RepID=UPI003B3AD158
MALFALAFLAAASTPSPATCQDHKPKTVKQDEAKAGTLARQPPADQIKAVLHSENGCAKPVVTRKNVGTGSPDGQHPDQ